MRIYCLVTLYLIIPIFSFAQFSSIVLSETNAKKLGELSKKATLYLVINNEKEPTDAALVSAVKNYWKIGAYKFMSKIEFLNLKSKNELSANNLYLYEGLSEGSMESTLDPTQLALYLSQIKTGCYYLASGLQNDDLNGRRNRMSNNYKLALSLKFDVSSTGTNNKDKVLDGYFDLMIKYFDNEILFCQKVVSIKDTKKENKDGIVYFGDGLNDIQTKAILLVKEQVGKRQPSEKYEEQKSAPVTAVSQFNPPIKNVYTVYPEDIKLALKKNDKQVLIYSNDMLLSACDGSVVAASGKYGIIRAKKDYGFWLAVTGLLASAFILATGMK